MDFGAAPCLLLVLAQESPSPITLTPRDGALGAAVAAVSVIATVVLIPLWEKWRKSRLEDQAQKDAAAVAAQKAAAEAAAEAKKAEREDRVLTFGQLQGLLEIQTKNVAQLNVDNRKLTDDLVVEKLKVRDLENRVANLTEHLAEARGTKAGG